MAEGEQAEGRSRQILVHGWMQDVFGGAYLGTVGTVGYVGINSEDLGGLGKVTWDRDIWVLYPIRFLRYSSQVKVLQVRYLVSRLGLATVLSRSLCSAGQGAMNDE